MIINSEPIQILISSGITRPAFATSLSSSVLNKRGIGSISLDGILVPISTYHTGVPQFIRPAIRGNEGYDENTFHFGHKNTDVLINTRSYLSNTSGNNNNIKSAWLNPSGGYHINYIALRYPMIMIGYGVTDVDPHPLNSYPFFDGGYSSIRIDGTNYYNGVPGWVGLSGINDITKYKVGPLDLRWNEFTQTWSQFFSNYSLYLKTSYITYPLRNLQYNTEGNNLVQQGSIDSTYNSVFYPDNTGCSWFDTQSKYYFLLRYNYKTYNVVMRYSGGCDWYSDPFSIYTEGTGKHLLRSHLSLFDNTINSVQQIFGRINIYTESNNIDDSFYDVYYDTIEPFHDQSHNTFSLINNYEWKGDGRLALFEYVDTIACDTGIINSLVVVQTMHYKTGILPDRLYSIGYDGGLGFWVYADRYPVEVIGYSNQFINNYRIGYYQDGTIQQRYMKYNFIWSKKGNDLVSYCNYTRSSGYINCSTQEMKLYIDNPFTPSYITDKWEEVISVSLTGNFPYTGSLTGITATSDPNYIMRFEIGWPNANTLF